MLLHHAFIPVPVCWPRQTYQCDIRLKHRVLSIASQSTQQCALHHLWWLTLKHAHIKYQDRCHEPVHLCMHMPQKGDISTHTHARAYVQGRETQTHATMCTYATEGRHKHTLTRAHVRRRETRTHARRQPRTKPSCTWRRSSSSTCPVRCPWC